MPIADAFAAREDWPCCGVGASGWNANAHLYETGGLRRTHLRGHTNILKRLFVHIGGFNLGLLMRTFFGVGTPRALQGHAAVVMALMVALWTHGVGSGRQFGTSDADSGSVFTPHHLFELLPIATSERAL